LALNHRVPALKIRVSELNLRVSIINLPCFGTKYLYFDIKSLRLGITSVSALRFHVLLLKIQSLNFISISLYPSDCRQYSYTVSETSSF
jgi:hypothetical protein